MFVQLDVELPIIDQVASIVVFVENPEEAEVVLELSLIYIPVSKVSFNLT
jgi:hypothetical protein